MYQHKSLLILLIFATITLLNIQIASCFSWHSSWELWDLELNGAGFLDEVSAWSATSLTKAGIKYYLCGNTYLMGGYGVLGGTKNQYFQRTYEGLPPHNQLNLSYVVYPLDSWDGHGVDDHYRVYVDEYTQIGWRFSWSTAYGVKTCGESSRPDYPPVLAHSTFVHSGSSMTIRFISMLDQGSTDESLAIRDVKMQFVNVTTPQYSLCGRSTANAPLPGWPCEGCDSSHQFQNVSTSGTCFECSASCASCSATETSCTSCYSGKYLDGSACNQCASSCATCEKSANYCLTCQPGLFMTSSNACYSTCAYPLYATESDGRSYCNTPCSQGEFAMWDSSCSSTCPKELNATISNGYQVCTFPCSITPVNL